MPRLPLASLQVFDIAARRLSFQAAADVLNLTPSAVSQRIRQLEATLGCLLFRRLTRQVVLTDAGQILAQRLRAPLAEIDAALAAVAGSARGERPVTVSTTASFAQECLLPVLGRFQIAHPDVRVKILVDNQLADIGGTVDIGVRQGMGHYPALQTRRLFQGVYVPVAAPALAGPAAEAPLIHVNWPAYFAEPPVWDRWQAETGIRLAGASAMVVPFESVAIQAAIAGQGIALVHHRYVAGHLARGDLVMPFGPDASLPTSVSHYLVRAATRVRPEVETLWSWLAEALA